MKTIIRLALLFLMLMTPMLVAAPIIAEFLASYDNGLEDEDGDREDWIEIHNPDPTAVSLSGWTLTDDVTMPAKWTFPNVTIPAEGRVLVFASGKDRAVAGSELHTNFSLSASGEYLALIKLGGAKTIEFNPYPKQKTDVSYGQASSVSALANASTPLKYFFTNPPNDAQGDTWTEDDFDDSGWNTGASGGIVLVVSW